MSLAGKKVDIKVDASRLRPEKSEVQRLLSDNRRAKQTLGWSPQVSLRDGLGQTIAWIKENLERYRPSQYTV